MVKLRYRFQGGKSMVLKSWAVSLIFLFLCVSATAFAETIPIFDAHNQMDGGLMVDEMISLMDTGGVQRIFLPDVFLSMTRLSWRPRNNTPGEFYR